MEQTQTESNESLDVTLLLHEHRLLDEKVHELAVQEHLTPEEKQELANLKKEKLRLKDLISSTQDHRETA